MKNAKYLAFFSLLAILFYHCDSQPYKQGANLYRMHCESCHMANGEGLRGLIPPLAQSDFLIKHQDQVACVIRYGMEGPVVVNGQTYETIMAGIPSLTDVQINNIINYINHAWGNDAGISNVRTVKEQLEKCQ